MRQYPWGRIVLFFTGVGLMEFMYRSLDPLARGQPPDWARVFMEEMTGMWAGLAITPVIAWLTLSYPLRDGRLKRRNARLKRRGALFAAAIALSLTDTTIIYGFRLIANAAMGRGVYDYGIMRIRYFMEMPTQLLWIAAIAGMVTYAEHRRLSRLRDER